MEELTTKSITTNIDYRFTDRAEFLTFIDDCVFIKEEFLKSIYKEVDNHCELLLLDSTVKYKDMIKDYVSILKVVGKKVVIDIYPNRLGHLLCKFTVGEIDYE